MGLWLSYVVVGFKKKKKKKLGCMLVQSFILITFGSSH